MWGQGFFVTTEYHNRMASINFLIRGTTKTKRVYFRYRPGRNFDLALATPFEIDAADWDAANQNWNVNRLVKGAKTSETKFQNNLILKFNNDLAEFRTQILNFIDSSRHLPASDLKPAISAFVTNNYFAYKVEARRTTAKPANFAELIEFYIDYRSVEDKTKGTKPIAQNTVKKYKTLQKILLKFDKNLKVTEINDVWRNEFVKYLNNLDYSASTQVKFLSDIKMLCRFADDEHDINKKVLNWTINRNPEPVAKGLHLSFEHLRKLKTTIMPSESLDNARDWLLISCYTSVRVSELLTFDENKIIDDHGNKYIMVQEKKNRNHKDQGLKCIYLLPEVVKILDKRGGQFPRKISEQKYNDYIKLVCKTAGFDEEVEGGKREITDGVNRKKKGVFPLWQLVSSHIGRATYVSLFSQYLPSEIIQMQTNHHSREMVDHYNKTELTEKLLQRAKVVAQAHSEIKLKIV